MAQVKELAEVLRSAADGLLGHHKRVSVALTAVGSELPVEDLLIAAQDASDEVNAVVIGPKAAEGLTYHEAADLPSAHQKMNALFQSGDIEAAVTLHYSFPLGVTTITCLICPATGRKMVLASTTGSSDTLRTASLVKNAISGVALAKAMGIKKPTVGLLNIDSVSIAERALKKLAASGYDLQWAGSHRADGGALMRGNDLIQGTPDVMVCDSLTGNLLVKLWSASQSGGHVETVGMGYGVGLGPDQAYPIAIISRASGIPVISQAMRFCGQLAAGGVIECWQEEWKKANACGLAEILKGLQPVAVAASDSAEVAMPEKTIVNDEIHGVDILEIEDAKLALWKVGIYAETGMGCTGPVVMVNSEMVEKAKEALKQFLS